MQEIEHNNKVFSHFSYFFYIVFMSKESVYFREIFASFLTSNRSKIPWLTLCTGSF